MISIFRKIKGLFFLFRLHYLVPAKFFNITGNISHLSRWISLHRKSGLNDFYSYKFDYSKRFKLYEHLLTTEKLDSNIDYLEFGVSQGFSFRWWAENIKNPEARFYGFDTFTGLPEDWGPFKKGSMSNGNEPPTMNDDRVTFYQGLFQQTVIPFLKSYDSKKRKVIHMDADLFSSTYFVLSQLYSHLNEGDIILFDEFNVPLHEFKAFKDWSESFYVKYELLAAVNNYYQVGFKILK